MIQKIKSSLFLKIFLLLAVLLFSVSFLLYGIVMAVMPGSYQALAASDYNEQVRKLVTGLEGSSLEEANDRLYHFCFEYNAAVKLEGNGDIISYGGEPEQKDTNAVQTATAVLELSDGTYQLYVSSSGKLANQITETFWRLLPVITVIVLIISFGAAFFVSRFLTKPIIEISGISKRLTALDMTWRCDTSRTDEIGILSANLNTMAGRLDKALNELTEANKELQADIERERRQEKLRVDFFRSVSHELKTPVTVLKGELEGMIYQVGEYKDRDRHLRQSMRTVNEMELLLQEILSASRMAGTDFNLAVSDVDLSRLIRECCRKWQGAAEDREQRFTTEIEDFCRYQGDFVFLQKAVSNVIGNAVLHSPKCGAITVTFKDRELRVENTGTFIADEDLDHIYEPFYRIDASRNSKTGGSGLGLYIVKNILERHGLRYQISNTDNGVCFTIDFS
ncbi:MAG: HAMP domain-containing sensor histidine kinase [Eubacteriales bacterium]|nr:HAMP domain-containing sensor histidine kinase [Eubacteriales bacterium]